MGGGAAVIHHELGCAYVMEPDGTKVAVDGRTPRDCVMAGEEPVAGDGVACMIEAVRDWLGWIFEEGPHPLAVTRRLVACTAVHAPWYLRGLPTREVRAVEAGSPMERSLRVICHQTPLKVHAALAQAYRRRGQKWAEPQIIATIGMRLMVESAGDASEALVRAQALEIWLGRVWDYSPAERWRPRLSEALKAIYVEARTLAPELILNMSGAEISALFHQGRAAESARVRLRVNAPLLRAGYRAQQRFQKSETACRRYAERARGNTHRASARVKVAAAVAA
jgi:hypothetical protein